MESLLEPKILFFSGGTALNSICTKIKSFTTSVTYIMPISDNGGSTAEILRVVGGPAIGDIRSRLIRLADDSTTEAQAVQLLLQHRLSDKNEEAARREWHSIVEGNHPMWNKISEPYKETIRAFLVHFNTEILRLAAVRRFTFSNGSIGNFFFTGARLFFASLETAIFWFSRISGIAPRTSVVPVINNNYGITIGVELVNGEHIHGQNEISHPNTNYLRVNKNETEPLPFPIKRVFYLNDDKQEIIPPVNPNVLNMIIDQDTIVYGMGSLYTSIIPLLILKGVGERIALKSGKKILILNGHNDRETHNMTAIDYILAITAALNRGTHLDYKPDDYITHVLYAKGTEIVVDSTRIKDELSIEVIEVGSEIEPTKSRLIYAEDALVSILRLLSIKQIN